VLPMGLLLLVVNGPVVHLIICLSPHLRGHGAAAAVPWLE